ncbi:MAG: hypothetical protein HOW73_43280 [Polyangiaceae bacterium]|nr:hypothetical protein [Polyangiaceae bacterium]
MTTQRTISHAEWLAEADRRFGKDQHKWRFVCPACGHIASIDDWKRAGAETGEVAFSCVGRHAKEPRDAFGKGPGPCNYAGGGLFRLNPVTVRFDDGTDHTVFEFAPMEDVAQEPASAPASAPAPKLSAVELAVLGDIAADRSPWSSDRKRHITTKAVKSLTTKGALRIVADADGYLVEVVTAAGRAALAGGR